jgi:hypothetical protein
MHLIHSCSALHTAAIVACSGSMLCCATVIQAVVYTHLSVHLFRPMNAHTRVDQPVPCTVDVYSANSTAACLLLHYAACSISSASAAVPCFEHVANAMRSVMHSHAHSSTHSMLPLLLLLLLICYDCVSVISCCCRLQCCTLQRQRGRSSTRISAEWRLAALRAAACAVAAAPPAAAAPVALS